MTGVIDIQDEKGDVVQNVAIQQARPGGFLGFYRENAGMYWQQLYIWDAPGAPMRDFYRTPYPLCASRDEVIEEAKKKLPDGGELKIVRIDL